MNSQLFTILLFLSLLSISLACIGGGSGCCSGAHCVGQVPCLGYSAPVGGYAPPYGR